MAGPRQRLQPGGKIVIVMTRWSTKDLTGQLIQAMSEEGGDKWEVVELPAILPSGKPRVAWLLVPEGIRKNQSLDPGFQLECPVYAETYC